MKKALCITLAIIIVLSLSACNTTETGTKTDVNKTIAIGDALAEKQPTPDDFDYSLERWNLVRRTYWVNGQREKALNYPCPISDVPLGYIVLITGSGAILGTFVVDGKISSLNSFLTPSNVDKYYSNGGVLTIEMPDVDGSYGENDGGIFFFTPDGKYIEWNGTYLYSDIPFSVDDPILSIGG